MVEKKFDVIVVGGGPAGSVCAALCAQQGKRVVLLERSSFPRDKVCGDYLNPKCWHLLERLGVAQSVRALPHHESPGFLFSTLAGRQFKVEFGENIRCGRNSVAISRRLLDHCLLQRARATGVEVWQETTMIGLRRRDDWLVELQTPQGRGMVAAPTLTGADGRHSFVGRHAGLMRKRGTDDRVGLQFTIRHGARMSDYIQLHQLRDGYCGAVKIGGGMANVCMVIQKKRAGTISFRSLYSNPVLGNFLDGAQLLEKPRSISPILGAEFRVGGDGVLLVGDAARVLEPFTGQGIYFAMRSGQLAAESITAGDLGNYAVRLQAEYRKECGTNRLLRRVLSNGWTVRGMAYVADLRPRWMEAIVRSVVE